jgi:glycine cleavage system H protein
VNEDPYGEGWVLKIEPSEIKELDELLDADAYQKLIGE